MLFRSVFTFLAPPKPEQVTLTFRPRPPPAQPRKRCRPVTDIDGEQSCIFRKKRRLRLFLITSRLSPEFSHPASNIVDRGTSRIAVWAKQRALGRNLLRKAAILNSMRRRALAVRRESQEQLARPQVAQGKEKQQLELARLAFVYGSHDPHTRPIFRRTPSFAPAAATDITNGQAYEKTKHQEPESPSPNLTPTPAPTVTNATEEPAYQSPNDAYALS